MIEKISQVFKIFIVLFLALCKKLKSFEFITTLVLFYTLFFPDNVLESQVILTVFRGVIMKRNEHTELLPVFWSICRLYNFMKTICKIPKNTLNKTPFTFTYQSFSTTFIKIESLLLQVMLLEKKHFLKINICFAISSE